MRQTVAPPIAGESGPMEPITTDRVRDLLRSAQAPCVSLLLPTPAGGSRQGPVRLRNLLRQAAGQLAERGLGDGDVHALLGSARGLLDDPAVWRQPGEGLAVFLCPGQARCFRLAAAPPAVAAVGRQFHVKPVLPSAGADGAFYVLALSHHHVRLLHCTAGGVRELDLAGVPTSIDEALRTHDRDEVLRVHSRPVGGVGTWAPIFSGQGVGIDDAKDNLLRFFQILDRGLRPVLRAARDPLVLAGVESLWPLYRKASTYKHLVDGGIAGNPDRASARDLAAQGGDIMAPYFREARRKAEARYAHAAGTGHATADLTAVLRSAERGHVELLFVARDEDRWGSSDAADDHVAVHPRREPRDEELLNLAAVHTLENGGAVFAVPAAEMPGGGVAAAVLRTPATAGGEP